MEKKKVRLLAVQTGAIIGDIETNISSAKILMEESLSNYDKTDFVFLPEVWNVGWDCPSFHVCAEEFSSSKSLEMLKSVAKKYSVNIIGGSVIQKKQNGEYANTCPVINRNGDLFVLTKKIICFRITVVKKDNM